MAVKTWAGGGQITRAKVMTLTVTASDTTNTITITCGSTPAAQSVVVTPTTATVATTAEEILEAIQAVVGGTFSELTVTQSGAVVTFTGPDGRPFTLSKADAGANATTLTTTVSPLSPNDISDPKNWLGGVAPTGGDQVVFENNSVSALWNLDTFNATVLASGTSQSSGIIRRRSFTGTIGLPPVNVLGFPEYRPGTLSVNCNGIFWESSSLDQPQQFRLTSTFAGALVTVIVQGDGTRARVGSESLELDGLPALMANTITVTGASIAFCPLQSQSGTAWAISVINGTLRIGVSATLSATLNLQDCEAQIGSSWTTMMAVDGPNSKVEVIGAAGGELTLQGGYTTWHSTGNPGSNPVIGGGATLDLNTAPATISVGGVVDMQAGGALLDEYGRGGNYVLKGRNCAPSEYVWTTRANVTFTMS